MKASEQLAKWISDENNLIETSQDEILKLVFQYPAVASFKLMLAKWQFLRQGAVEEGLWQQLLLQWPNPAQLFVWRSKSFNFKKEEKADTYQIPPTESFIKEPIPAVDKPVKAEWDWGRFMEEMRVPVPFIWEIPEAIKIAEIEELPVFDFLLQAETETETMPVFEEFKFTDDLPIKKEEEIIEIKKWNWTTFVNENLDHISSVWISQDVFELNQIEEIPIVVSQEIAPEAEDEPEESVPIIEKNDIFSVQSSVMDSTEEFHPSAFVQWLQNQKPLQVKEKIQTDVLKSTSGNELSNDEQEVKKHKKKIEKGKVKNKEKEKHKKKDKKKKKLKKKDQLEEEIYSSLEFSDDIASETYASLLAKQGHYELSERIYERLRLIYPEKSSYFAGLIKKLKP